MLFDLRYIARRRLFMKKGFTSLIVKKPAVAKAVAQCCAKTSQAVAGCHD